MSRWHITNHAIERYRDLVGGSLSDALSQLTALCNTAHLVTTVAGTEHWRAGRPTRIQFRVRDGALVTVLPANAAHKRKPSRGRHAALARSLLVLRDLLRSGTEGVPVVDFPGDCAGRTRYRDIDALVAAGIPVEKTPNGYRVVRSKFFAWLDGR